MDEIVNQAAKMCYMTGGQTKVPLVIRTATGAGISAAAQHSERIEAWYVHIPGLKVAYPSTPADAKGLLKTAIRDDNPVIFFEHVMLYSHKGEIPEEKDFLIPFGKADIKRTGKNLTVVATGILVIHALKAAEELAKEGIEIEVIDPRTLVPFDKETVLHSVKKTGRLIIATEETKRGSFASEVSAVVSEEGLLLLKQPIKRVCAPDAPVPFSSVLEKAYLPGSEKIIAAVKEMV